MPLTLPLFLLLNFQSIATPVLWVEPARIEAIDFTVGAGGVESTPKPPFEFLQEDFRGTSPKIVVKDSRNVRWRVKGGPEARPETFSTRLIAALGYFTERIYFFANGRIEGVRALKRAAGFVGPDGAFTYASFERIEPDARFVDDITWTWIDSPFKGTPQLQGLKILVMLLSNWDNKDARDSGRGSNTSVMAVGEGQALKHLYFVNDWGQTLGRWGNGGYFGRQSMWDCRGFSEQTKQFVTSTKANYVRFGFTGQHVNDFKHDITVADVRWLLQYLGRITDAQIRTGLMASGATKDEEECFCKSVRQRIEQLQTAAKPTGQSTSR